MCKFKSLVLAMITTAFFAWSPQGQYSNNPVIQGQGVCDPHITLMVAGIRLEWWILGKTNVTPCRPVLFMMIPGHITV